MPRIAVGTENDASIEIQYEDHGSGQPVVLIHGYPLDGSSWERQERELLASGQRVISYDRRGFGRSSRPTVGYDYDTFAADLNALLEQLDLSEVVLVGFSMGSGEVCRYLGTYGSKRVRKAALLGDDPAVPARDRRQPRGRRPAGRSTASRRRSSRTATPISRTSSTTSTTSTSSAAAGSATAPGRPASTSPPPRPRSRPTRASRPGSTDFRADLPSIDVPVLVLHGTDDRILPFDATAARLPALIADCTLVPVEGGPQTSPGRTPTRSTALSSNSSPRR